MPEGAVFAGSKRLKVCASSLVGVLVTLVSVSAHAQASDTVLAEALFQQGRALLQEGKVTEACPKLAESNRLDPATGTLFALALCHEQEGKLASAWAEFSDAEGRARREGRQDRETLAKEHSAALFPRLSTLTVDVSSEAAAVEGLEVRLDGRPIGQAAWGAPMPVDGGEHRLEASAPGRKPWSSAISTKTERDVGRLSVPVLEVASSGPAATPIPAQPAAPATTGKTAPPQPFAPTLVPLQEPKKDSAPWGTMEWAGVATAGAGVLALGAGGYFLATALQMKEDADCNDQNECDSLQGVRDRNDAVSNANIASVFGIAGAALAGTGATLFIIGRSKAGSSPSPRAAASVAIDTHGLGLSLRGAF